MSEIHLNEAVTQPISVDQHIIDLGVGPFDHPVQASNCIATKNHIEHLSDCIATPLQSPRTL